MVAPFIAEDLFEVSEDLVVDVHDDGYIIIDNYYKNYNEIHNLLQSMPVPNWKRSQNSRNFIDYYDCRPIINNLHYGDKYAKGMNNILQIIEDKFNEIVTVTRTNYIEFNYFKHINVPSSNKFQFFPHRDSPVASITYLDKICSGGTALYKNLNLDHNNEGVNLLYDVSKIEKTIIEAKPNRMVIFRGTIMHGGYIEDHSEYLNDWRINEVNFFKRI